MQAGLRSMRAAVAVALVAFVFAACGDSAGTGPTPTTVVGNWNVTSLTAPTQPSWGDAVKDDGMSISLALTSGGSYTLTASGDDPTDPWVCTNTASCSYTGTYSTSGNTITWDQGTASEATATFSFSAGSMTINYAANAVITDPYKLILQPK